METPREYVGREQSYLKHRVLEHYLDAWAHKLGSNARYRTVELVYVDCFSGPWLSQSERLQDTSVHIGLGALTSAARRWRSNVQVKAVFVEKDPESFARLQKYLADHHRGPVRTVAIQGRFHEQVDRIELEIGRGDAFLFIDPTGWKGVAMEAIAPLARKRKRDVMINLMWNHLNRFKDDQREFLREQMREFFGTGDEAIPVGLSEDELVALYREKLKEQCGLEYVANLAVPHPKQERTWFHLVVGGHHPEVIKLFRDVEGRVCGREADEVRADVRARENGQDEFLFGSDWNFGARHEQSIKDVRSILEGRPAGTRRDFKQIWTRLLQDHHVTRAEVARLIRELARNGRVSVDSGEKRALDDKSVVTWNPP